MSRATSPKRLVRSGGSVASMTGPPTPPSPSSSLRSAPVAAGMNKLPPPADDDFLCLFSAGPLQLGSRVNCFRHSSRTASSTTFAVFFALLLIALNLATSFTLPALPSSLNSRRSLISEQTQQAVRNYFSTPEATVTVLLDRRTYDFPFSVFLAGTVERFGTGRFDYSIQRFESSSSDKKKNAFGADIKAPCMLASAHLDGAQRWRDKFAPHCRFMLTSDEYCNGAASPGISIRQYDGASMTFKQKLKNLTAPVYLPLGPRLDFWAAFEEKSDSDDFRIPKSSERGLVFNAMFSKSTSESREELAKILLVTNGTKYGDRSMIRIAESWTKTLSEDHVGPAKYTETLLDSVFTLSPTGHHPECYRMFEAMEAGSIPIIALDDDYRQHKCTDSLRLMRKSNAPLVLLPTWRALPQRLEDLMANPEALDKQQEELATWYKEFMRTNVQSFESVFVQNELK